jgi:putative transposase
MESRKVEYRIYPTPSQHEGLLGMLGMHQRLYNAALDQRITAYRQTKTSIGFEDQCKDLTELRADDNTYADLNAQSSQVTLKRIHLAFDAFFRRCKAGQTPGFPRFKSFDRYSGWGYKSHGDGFKFTCGDGRKHGSLRLSGIGGNLKLRGKARNVGEVATCEIVRKNGKWYASITMRCTPIRTSGPGAAGHDWGVSKFATYAYEDGTYEEVDNPRFFARHRIAVERAQQHLDDVTIKDSIGRPLNAKDPIRIAAKRALGRAKTRQANCLKDFQHKQSAQEVAENCLLVTEHLVVKNMTKSAKGTVEKPGKNVAQKAGLNREILATAPARYNLMRKYKAAEAGIWLVTTPTRKLKPTQRCSGCWELPKKKKKLDERTHHCEACGLILGRDQNAAKVNLLWAFMMLEAAFGSRLGREPAGNSTPYFYKIGWSSSSNN